MVKKCPACGADLEAGDTYCWWCGKSLPQASVARYCGKCGASVRPDDGFCASCGVPLTEHQPKLADGSNEAGRGRPAGQTDLTLTWRSLSSELRPAPFLNRFGAWVIDDLIQGVAVLLILCPFALILGGASRSPGSSDTALSLLIYGLLLTTTWLYNAVLESSERRATVGKQACDVMVVDLEGRRISFGRASVRFWAKLLLSSGVTFGLGYLLALVTRRRQALHDLIAGTVVVERAGYRG